MKFKTLIAIFALTGGALAQSTVKDTTNTHGERIDSATERTAFKTALELQFVDNTSDVNKPLSTAQAIADAAVQAFAIQRANHTGTQAQSTITNLETDLAALVTLTTAQTISGIKTHSAALRATNQSPASPTDVTTFATADIRYQRADQTLTTPTYSASAGADKTFITSKSTLATTFFDLVTIHGVFLFANSQGPSLKFAEYNGLSAGNVNNIGAVFIADSHSGSFGSDIGGVKYMTNTVSNRLKLHNSGVNSDGLRYRFTVNFAANAGDTIVMSPSGHTFIVDQTITDATVFTDRSTGGVFVRSITGPYGTAPTGADTSLTVNGGGAITTTFAENSATATSTMPDALIFPSSSGWYIWDGNFSSRGTFKVTYNK